jgi:hypothetical protein
VDAARSVGTAEVADGVDVGLNGGPRAYIAVSLPLRAALIGFMERLPARYEAASQQTFLLRDHLQVGRVDPHLPTRI